MSKQPNIVYFFVDNLGYGELGCYGGGILRGAQTANIDRFASEGIQLLNFAPEAQCTPSRSALMTGRYAARSGTNSVASYDHNHTGLVAWERTTADILSESGYRCAIYGKWHIGAEDGRWPTDHGFDEWYGIPGTYDEALWANDPWYDPTRDGISSVLRSSKGESPRTVKQLTVDVKRNLGREYLDEARDFMKRSASSGEPFFLYFNHPLLHVPVLPSDEYKDKSGNGVWADSLMELDGHFAEILESLGDLGIEDNTIVVFFGDNGSEELLPDRGTSGFWEGSYFTGMEGSLRTPCLIRYPGHVQAGVQSNEIVHITDLFTTTLLWARCTIPNDRIIDGVDQRGFFEDARSISARDGFLFWNGDKFYGAKWRNFKLSFYDQRYSTEPEYRRAEPKIINLLVDPKERENYDHKYRSTWTIQHFRRLISEYEESLKVEAAIPSGAPLDYVP